MMSKRRKVYLAAAALIVTAVVPVTLLSTWSAGASTAACGSPCTSPSSESLGSGEALTVSGSSVVMATASTSDSTQDWTTEAEGTVANAVSAGVVSARLDMQYSTDTLVEFQYAPDGDPSDKCLANTASDAVPTGDTPVWYAPTLTVVLGPCGITAQSLWIIDQDTLVNSSNGYTDLINAGYATSYTYDTPVAANDFTSPFAEPEVLTVGSASGSGGSDDVVLAPLSEIGGVVSAAQMWTAFTAADQSALRAQIDKSR